MRISFVMIAMPIISMNSAIANIIYVPQDYPTIQEGIYAALSGDTVQVAPGTYSGFYYSGNALIDVHVFGAGGVGDSTTKLQGNGTGDGIYLDDVIGWEIAGFEIFNYYYGAVIECSYNVDFHHNYIHHNIQPYTHGLETEYCTDTFIHHNVLAYNSYVAFNVKSGNENLHIVNNTILYTTAYHAIWVFSYNTGLEIVNNILAFNNGDGVQFAPWTTQGDAILVYNDNYGNGGTWQNCTPGIGNIYSDPQFLNIPQNPFALRFNSPCIDAGDPTAPLDPDGTIADMGAFYFDQTPPAIVDVTTTVSGENIILNWENCPGARVYHIYRSFEPYFDLVGMVPFANSNISEFTDFGALNEEHCFYCITWEN